MIEVELSAAEVAIEPGGRAQLTVTVHNRQPHDDHIALEIEGIDVEWYALPVPAFNASAGGSQAAQVLFKIARSSESRADTYPFLVRARSMESGDFGVQQGTLVIKPYSGLQVDLNPKRAVSTYFEPARTVEIAVSNLGNRDDSLTLFATDPEDAFTYEFDPERVRVAAGRTQTIPLRIEPRSRPVLGSGRLHGYTVTARSIQDSFVSASTNGQIERRAMLSPVAAVIALLILLLGGGYALLRPRPVSIRSFTASTPVVVAGQPVTLAWNATNVSDGYIEPGNLPVHAPVGSISVAPDHGTIYKLVLRGGGHEETRTVEVAVNQPEPVAPPRIVEFTASAYKIHQGESVTLSWKVTGATVFVLNPISTKEGDATLVSSMKDSPDQTTTYVLAVKNSKNDRGSKSLTVTVVPPTQAIAQIDSFRARPEKILPGKSSTLSWRVQGATNVSIDNGVGTGLKSKGSFDVTPVITTVYTLTATDNKLNPVTKSVTVTVLPPPPPEQTNPTVGTNPAQGQPSGNPPPANPPH